MTARVIKNPSEEELQKLKKENSAEGTPLSKVPQDIVPQDELMKSYTKFEPKGVFFKLPSQGRLFDNKNVQNEGIFIRRMTTIEESIFLKIKQNTVALSNEAGLFKTLLNSIDTILESCIKTNISLKEISLIDKFPLFVYILGLTYGFDQAVELTCPVCGNNFKTKIDIYKTLTIKYLPENLEYPRKIKSTSYKNIEFLLHYPSIAESKIFFDSQTELLQLYLILLNDIIGTSNDGQEITKEDWNDILTNLNTDDRNAIQSFINEFGAYGTDLQITSAFCENKECTMFHKPQNVTLPLNFLFSRIF